MNSKAGGKSAATNARRRAGGGTRATAAGGLSHVDEGGRVRMVDISAKRVTFRRAVASAEVEMSEATWRMLAAGGLPKGDALAAARVAGIQAAKRTWELIPLCHPLALEGVEVELGLERPGRVWIVATVRVRGRTGAEMEALTAAVAAALTIYDMCKSVERGMRIGRVQLLEKSGGRSGRWSRESGAR